MRRLLESPPQSPVHPVTDIYHGICISDPYRWLEDKDSADTREWLNNQETYLRLYLESVPGRDLVRERIHRLLSVDVIDTPRKVGNRIFFLKREARQEQPVITMREGLDGTDISLLDP